MKTFLFHKSLFLGTKICALILRLSYRSTMQNNEASEKKHPESQNISKSRVAKIIMKVKILQRIPGNCLVDVIYLKIAKSVRNAKF